MDMEFFDEQERKIKVFPTSYDTNVQGWTFDDELFTSLKGKINGGANKDYIDWSCSWSRDLQCHNGLLGCDA